jgi:hypothetical protein
VTGGQRSPTDLAAAAYEAIRALNQATFPGQLELTDPHDLYTALANLSALLRITRKHCGRTPLGGSLLRPTAWTARTKAPPSSSPAPGTPSTRIVRPQ